MKTLLIFILCLISVTYVQTQDVESSMWPTQTNASSASTAQPDQNDSSAAVSGVFVFISVSVGSVF
ncbi:hypothetical protein PDJAM_G00163350, partial [Pangasius djambal]|nr:hypothetical protein [Pangasius djambal]